MRCKVNTVLVQKMGGLADKAYTTYFEGETFFTDEKSYKVVAVSDMPSGFQGMLVEELNDQGDGSDQYIFAFRGTETPGGWGWLNPFEYEQLVKDLIVADIVYMGGGTVPQQMKDAMAFVKAQVGSHGLSATNTVFTGHSLGGSIAGMASYVFGFDAYTYNGFGIANMLWDANDTSLADNPREIVFDDETMQAVDTYQTLGEYLEILGVMVQHSTDRIVNIVQDGYTVSDLVAGILTDIVSGQIGETHFVLNHTGDAGGLLANHSILTLNHSIAIYNNILTLFPGETYDSLTAAIRFLGPADKKIDRVLTCLGELAGISITDIKDPVQTSKDIAAAHDAVGDLSFGYLAVSSAGVLDAGATESRINSLDPANKADLYALLQLLPFTINGNSTLYDQFPELTETYSAQFSVDRKAFLFHLTCPNSTSTDNIEFFDAALGIVAYSNIALPVETRVTCQFGGAGDQVLTGGDLADHLYGMVGNDVLIGGNGNDFLEGGGGLDILKGGAGNDTFFIQGQATNYDEFDGGSGTDTILGGAGDDIIRVHALLVSHSIEQIDGGEGDNQLCGTVDGDTIDLSGTLLTNIAAIHGEDGADTITGAGGNDHIHGDSGADILKGGTGNDTLNGGDGIDTYVINSGDGHDTIIDDGNNLLKINGEIFSGVLFRDKGSDNYTLTSESGTVSHTYTLSFDSTPQLIIDGTTSLTFANQTSVADFDAGQFGLTLCENEAPAAFDLQLTGTEASETSEVEYFEGESVAYFYGFWQVSAFNPDNTNEGSWLYFEHDVPLETSLTLSGGAGNDRLEGMLGADHLIGGAGNDGLWGVTYELCGFPVEQQLGDWLEGGAGIDLMGGGGGDDMLYGGDDPDILLGLAGDDLLMGEDGNDLVVGNDDGDTLCGEAGDDLLIGDGLLTIEELRLNGDPVALECVYADGYLIGMTSPDIRIDLAYAAEGNDRLFGGAGKDCLIGGLGDDVLSGDDDEDVLWGDNDATAVHGGNDTLHGGSGDDLLYGAGGSDFLEGGSGADELYGGEHNDLLFGEEGNDRLWGDNPDNSGSGRDEMHGGSGNDQLMGAGGDDLLYGEEGNDTLWGDDPNNGGSGNDLLDGGMGNDQLVGGGGDDTLWGKSGTDTLSGGAGDDLYVFSTGDCVDYIDDQQGQNLIRFASLTSLASLEWMRCDAAGSGTVSYSRTGLDIILRTKSGDAVVIDQGLLGGFSFELANGTRYSFNDFLDQTTEYRQYGEDDESVSGSDDDDLIFAGDGGDTVHGQEGNDAISGGNGFSNEFVFFLRKYSSWLPDGFSTDWSTGETESLINNNDELFGDAGNDILDGGYGSDWLYGGTGDDALWGGDERDFLYGEDGEDLLCGGAGNDELDGGGGKDRLEGRTGDDLLEGGLGADYLDGGEGEDCAYYFNSTEGVTVELNTGSGSGGDAEGDVLVNIESVVGSPQADWICGDANDNRLNGAGGQDVLLGGDGDDMLGFCDLPEYEVSHSDCISDPVLTIDQAAQFDGGNGNDTLVGGRYSDILVGGMGDDYLSGFMGHDIMRGGDGDDVLVDDTTYETPDDSFIDIMEGGAGNDIYRIDSYSGGIDIICDQDGHNTVQFVASWGPSDLSFCNLGFVSIDMEQVHSFMKFDYWLDYEESPEENAAYGELANVITGMSHQQIWIPSETAQDLYLAYNPHDNGQARVVTIIQGGRNAELDITYDFGKGHVYTHAELLAEMMGRYQSPHFGEDNNMISGDDFGNEFWGGGGNDTVRGGDGNDTLHGEAGDDGLDGDRGDDLLVGGIGNDHLRGGAGNDVYLFNRGDGQDVIDDFDLIGSSDTLRFGEDVADTDILAIAVEGDGSDLWLRINNSTDQVRIGGYFNPTHTGDEEEPRNSEVERIEFANGVVWDAAMIRSVMVENRAPAPNGSSSVVQTRVGEAFSLVIPDNIITDPDAWDWLTYSITSADEAALPAWLSFDAVTRTLSGNPDVESLGSLELIVRAQDSCGAAAEQTMLLTILPANRAPEVVEQLADTQIAKDKFFSSTIDSACFFDPDGDALMYSATLADGSALPAWLVFDPVSRTFSGRPDSLGSISVRVTVVDSAACAASDTFVLTVIEEPSLLGTEASDLLKGGAGNDVIRGLGGNDILRGGAGADLLDGGAGADLLHGGPGTDTADYRDSDAGVTVNLTTGMANGGLAEGDILWSIENVHGSNEEDRLVGSDANNLLIGDGGNDDLRGKDGADTLLGGAGHDILRGGAGADLLDGGAGADLLHGGQDVDTADYRDSDAGVTVNLATGMANGGLAEGDILWSIENVHGSNEEDRLVGSERSNRLIGHDGNDVLAGGLGNDILIGGEGNDVFVFDSSLSTTANNDRIRDFVTGQDLIQLDLSLFTSLAEEGTLGSEMFCANATGSPLDSNDYIVYNTSSGALFYDADGSGQGDAWQFATLTGKPDIALNDFLIVA